MQDRRADRDQSLRDSLDGISSLLSHRIRLGICVLLSRHTALSFSRLKELLEETDGSLGSQLRRLEDEGLITASKEFQNRKPVTWYTLTKAGRAGLRSHLEALAELING